MSSRALLRAAAVLVSLALIGLWAAFLRGVIVQAHAIPGPGGVMLPVFFSGLALGAALAAFRGEGIPVALAGGLSLLPMGIVLLFFPGPARLIPLLDLSLIAIGVLMMRREPDAPEEDAGVGESEG